MQLKAERMDLARLVRDVANDRAEAFTSAGISLALEVPSEPAFTTGDPLRLSQVFGNLLGNALKFTDRGGEVRVRLSVAAVRKVAVLSIKDTGIGIDRAVLPRVFDAFVQADRAVERSRGGLGLGLALVKGLVELHGGSVGVTSDGPGKGAEFVVELPFIELTGGLPAAPAAATEKAACRRVLVIEDNVDSAESLQMYLELLGHEVRIAHTGSDGIRAATASVPDVVVCDIGLPGMSGHIVCAELRKLAALSHTLFVALSGHAVDSPVTSGESATGGFDVYLLKPVNPERLAEVVAGARMAPS